MNRNSPKYKKKRLRQHNSMYLWFFVLMFSTVLGGIFLYMHYQASIFKIKDGLVQQMTTYFPRILQKKTPFRTAKAQVTTDAIKPIHFDFYNELPKTRIEEASTDEDEGEIELPPSKALTVAAPAPMIPKELTPGKNFGEKITKDTASYILQVGIFHDYEVANRYRTALAGAGLKIDLVKVRVGRELVYSLQQGPFRADQLKLARKRLSDRGVTCDIRKLTPYLS
jgi:cell division protein FtsN